MNESPGEISQCRINEALKRQAILDRLAGMEGAELKAGAENEGVPLSTLYRWRKDYVAGDFCTLIPKKGTGRPSVKEQLEKKIGPAEVKRNLEIVRAYNLDMKTNRGAARFAAATRPDFHPAMKAELLVSDRKASKQNIAASLLDETRVTRVQRLGFQGRKALRLRGGWVPRIMDVLPGDIFVPDDTTPIWGWWVPWPKCREYPFGKKVLQGQLLLMIDFASTLRLAYSMIAREKSSYRACDCWSFYGSVFDDIGVPRLGMMHEGGVWQGKMLRGELIENAPGEIEEARRVGGFNLLPTTLLPFHHQMANVELPATLKVWRSVVAKSKPVEMAFRMSQRLEGTLWGCLGTDQRRDPFEKNLKVFHACQRGTADPANHFLSLTDLLEKLTPLFDYQNNDPMEGRVYKGKPGDIWEKGMMEHGNLKKLPEGMRWMYRRSWRTTTVKGPFITLSYKDGITGEKVTVSYQNPELFARLDERQVVIYFDEEVPELPAEIVSLNGEHLGQALYWVGTGSFINRNEEGFQIQSRFDNTVMSSVRTIGKDAPSQQLPPEIAARRAASKAEAEIENRTPLAGGVRENRRSRAMTPREIAQHGMNAEERAASDLDLMAEPKRRETI